MSFDTLGIVGKPAQPVAVADLGDVQHAGGLAGRITVDGPALVAAALPYSRVRKSMA
jgi:hypothetical protein